MQKAGRLEKGLKPERHEYYLDAANDAGFQMHKLQGAAAPHPQISPGIFKDFPSPLPIADSHRHDQTSPTDPSGADLPHQPQLNG